MKVETGLSDAYSLAKVSFTSFIDLTVKISDIGGGISRSNWKKLHRYTYTTSEYLPDFDENGNRAFLEHFSGGGYGIPLAKLYARYFGGDITIISMEGFGTDAYIEVKRLQEKIEVIPNFNIKEELDDDDD